MKKVLWICNIMLPAIAKELSLPYSNREGWLSGIFEQLAKGMGEIRLGICFPMENFSAENVNRYAGMERNEPIDVKGIPCYAFLENLEYPEHYDLNLEKRFAEIYKDFEPDMIHVFGTEFPHALAAVRAFGRPERTLIGIQGLCYKIAEIYMAKLPQKVCRSVTFRDFIRRDSIRQQQEKFRLRGENEKEAIMLAGHITGRTRFDREGTATINQKAVYHSMNETMRSGFYNGQWKQEECERYSIFLGQGDYPLKGFHFMLEAMPDILQKYPDAVLYVAGSSIIENRTLKEKLKLPAYGKYLLSLIERYGLKGKVIMLGKLSEEEMKQRFLKSHVYVCASILENSPNTIGEAMLLGVPVVASAAGGIPDMLTDGREGLLFAPGEPMKLAHAIEAVFDKKRDEDGNTLAQKLSLSARKRGRMTHDGDANYKRLLEIYQSVVCTPPVDTE